MYIYLTGVRILELIIRNLAMHACINNAACSSRLSIIQRPLDSSIIINSHSNDELLNNNNHSNQCDPAHEKLRLLTETVTASFVWQT